jgi:cytochrome c oxidase subunit 2
VPFAGGGRWWWMPPDAAVHGAALDRLMRWDLGAMAACLLLANGLLVIAVLRRRRRVEGGRRFPSVWTFEAIPLAALAMLFGVMTYQAEGIWAKSRFQGASAGAMQVEVVGQQFQWYFHYPGADGRFGRSDPSLVDAAGGNPIGLDPADEAGHDDLVTSELVLPEGREVDLGLRSLDVIHGFFVPALRVKQDAVPGMESHIHFTPMKSGTYVVLCSQLCGLGHARMQAKVRVLPGPEYGVWAARTGRVMAEER